MAKVKVIAYQISETIDVLKFKESKPAELIYFDSSRESELFYQIYKEQYISVFKYGIVCFFNIKPDQIERFIKLAYPYTYNRLEWEMIKEFDVETYSHGINFGFNKLDIGFPQSDIIKLIILNVSQSLTLEYYTLQTKILFNDVNKHSLSLEQHQKLSVSNRELKRIIGKVLSIKNRLVTNLYILEASPGTYKNETLKKIDLGLKDNLEMYKRSETLHEELKIIREQLELFNDIVDHAFDVKLEMIIIGLIVFEIINTLIEYII
ncbi:MAG: RMD1 family protein [Bacteroidetes bacterium]|nr:RMD1 family protein [Bacteroidota bacterium]